MNRIVFSLSEPAEMAEGLARHFDADLGELETRRFPDGETYLRLLTPVSGRDVVLLATLDRPDAKLAPLLFAVDALRDQGARSVALAAPYLAYMRQDKVFHSGEAVTSRSFARLLSFYFDFLVTVDPHLHRITRLDEIYTVPAKVIPAAPSIAEWIETHIPDAFLIGPDEESEQWVRDVAERAKVPSAVLEKQRWGDFDVAISGGSLRGIGDRQPVIIDDIASSARTLIETVKMLLKVGAKAPICIVVHPIFAGDAYQDLLAAGVARVISVNAIEHETNTIDISRPIAEALCEWSAQNDELIGAGV
ncbi:ribose-phosphate pyrophosphokinase [Aurantiacibacter atlanticus]|nr:ribose-phosphate pyrophosphokinase [Aurantiacibacter atlanticus]